MPKSQQIADSQHRIGEIGSRSFPQTAALLRRSEQSCADSLVRLDPSEARRSGAQLTDLWIDTDHQGRILEASAAALSALLGYSARTVQGRLLPIMLLDNRPNDTHFHHVMLGHPVDREGTIRPREQRGVRVCYRIVLAPNSTDRAPVLRWTFHRR